MVLFDHICNTTYWHGVLERIRLGERSPTVDSCPFGNLFHTSTAATKRKHVCMQRQGRQRKEEIALSRIDCMPKTVIIQKNNSTIFPVSVALAQIFLVC